MSVQPILPGATIGMLGGGQLGRMFVQAARQMGYEVIVMDPDPESPAAALATDWIQTGFSDPDALDLLAERCDVVTTEFENVPAASLEQLILSVPVHPAPKVLYIAQNRLREKRFVESLGIAVTPYQEWPKAADCSEPELDFPVVLKTASMGYDGQGQWRCRDLDEWNQALLELEGRPAIVEKMLDLKLECSVVLARSSQAEVMAYPVVENRHRHGILDFSIAPAQVSSALQQQMQLCAERLARALEYVGVLAVEFFIDQNEQIYFNEMAPRPHNSGHFTIDACYTSQFEQQLRAVCGLPLGSPEQHSPAVMWNILGDLWGTTGAPLQSWLEMDQAHLHLYGKSQARAGRKMGHITFLNQSIDEVEQQFRHLQSAPQN